MEEEKSKVVFKAVKKRKAKNFRSRANRDSDEEDDKKSKLEDEDEVDLDKLEETKEIQKLRQRPNGISHVTLASGIRVSKVEEEVGVDASDPFKLKTGGLLDLAKAKQAKALEDPSAKDRDISGLGDVGTQFSRETRVRDEDEEMRKFIESEMERRKRSADPDGNEDGDKANKYLSPEERALMSLPDHLRKSTFRKNEEMLSSQMLSGIPEVDLGIEEKIRNIEATEEAKKAMAAKQAKDKQSEKKSADFVPSNLAVNFRQPDRFKNEMEAADVDSNSASASDQNPPKKSSEVVTQRTVVVGDVPMERRIEESADVNRRVVVGEKATDDMHLTKFKQHFQRK